MARGGLKAVPYDCFALPNGAGRLEGRPVPYDCFALPNGAGRPEGRPLRLLRSSEFHRACS